MTLPRPFLLECTSKEVRHSYSDVLSMAVQSSLGFGCEADRGPVASIVDCVLAMLEKDVVDNCKSCCEYFEFLKNYASYVREERGVKFSSFATRTHQYKIIYFHRPYTDSLFNN